MLAPIESLASYFPDLVLRRFAANPVALSAPEMERFPAAVLFADLRGFTGLVERFALRGPVGAEDLTDLLNTYFGHLIEQITTHGGDIVKMAGDALIVLWPAPTEAALGEEVIRAAQCSLAVQASLNEYAVADDLHLSLRVTVGAGDVVTMYVGGVLGRWELLLAGAPLVQMGLAQKQAQPGEVVLSRQAWERVYDRCVGAPLDLGHVRLHAVEHPVRLFPAVRPALAPETAAALRGCVPATVASRLADAQVGWLNELRRVTVLFVNLPELNYDSPNALEETQTIMQELQGALYRYEGSINKLSVDDKGVTLIAALGLPPLAHEDDAVRAVGAAQSMQTKLRQMGVHSAIGIATGQVFCGVVGSTQRREYTMYGEVMPLVARLMQAAPEDILCDSATYQAARERLMFEALPEIIVKGKTKPIAIYRPQGTVAPGSTLGPMLGRARERALLETRLAALQAGQSGTIVIEGEAGIGKSRLVGALVEQARARGITPLIGAGDAIEVDTPYFAWRSIFCHLLAIEETTDSAIRRQQVLEQLPEPTPLRWTPLLNSVLPLELPENEITAQMTGTVRADNIQLLLLRLLQALVPPRPTVLILEDAHWMDSASWRLATMTEQCVHPVLLVLVMRPALEAPFGEARPLLHAPETQRLILNPLSPDEVLGLVRQRLDIAVIPTVVMALIGHRAQGNPFFSEELALALRDSGLILLTDGRCQIAPDVDMESVTLPDTVQGVIIHRIDRLTPAQQIILKTASVIGQTFSFDIIRDICPLEAERERLAEHLRVLEQLDIVWRDHSAPQPLYVFRHVITQEVAYNRMLFAQRRQLHRAVAEWYERTCADLAPFYPALAYHWDRAQEKAKTLDYLDRAGERALQSGAYEEAIRFLGRALALGMEAQPEVRRHPSAEAMLLWARWERQMGEAELGLGHSLQSRQHLKRAIALLGYPLPSVPSKLALELIRQGLVQGLRRAWFRRLPLLSAERQGIAREMARICERLGEIYYIANEQLPLLSAILHSVNFAEVAGPSPELARAYANVGLAAGLIPMRFLADIYCRLALDTAAGIDQLSARAWVLEVTGLYRLGIGQWEKAREALNQAVEIYDRLEDRAHWRESLALLAEATFHQGDFAEFARMYTRIYENARQSDNAQAQIWAINGVADSALMCGESKEAIRWLEEAILLGKTALKGNTDPPNDVLAHGLLALAHWWNGEPDQARREAEVAAALIVRLPPVYVAAYQGYIGVAEVYLALWEAGRRPGGKEDPILQQKARQVCAALRRFSRVFPIARPRALLCQGLVDSLSGRPARARRVWRDCLRAAIHLEMPFEEAMAHYEIGRHLQPDDPARHRHLTQSIEIFARLGAGCYLARAQSTLAESAVTNG